MTTELLLLHELRRSTGGTLSIRLTPYPLATGIIATNSTPDLRGEPKFVLTTADSHWYDNFLNEAEELWVSASPQPLLLD
jgi:hypothetical protein